MISDGLTKMDRLSKSLPQAKSCRDELVGISGLKVVNCEFCIRYELSLVSFIPRWVNSARNILSLPYKE